MRQTMVMIFFFIFEPFWSRQRSRSYRRRDIIIQAITSCKKKRRKLLISTVLKSRVSVSSCPRFSIPTMNPASRPCSIIMCNILLTSCLISMCTSIFTQIALPNDLNAAKTIAVSSSGRYLVIADSNAQYIRILDMNSPSAWLASTGTGNKGCTDESPETPQLCNPFGVTILENSSGPQAIYVADSGNHCIRNITWSTWELSVFSGLCHMSGKADGTQPTARYNNPQGIATVGNDTAYIADTGNCIIRKLVISTANVTTLATSFSNPTTVCTIYIAGAATSAFSTMLWASVGTTTGSSSGLVKITLSGSSETAVTVFSNFGGGGVAVSPPDSEGISWVYVASSTLVGSLRTVNASNTAIYANSSDVATSVVMGMSINGTTAGANVIAIVDYGNQVGALNLSGISAAPTGAAKPHTKTTSSSATSSLSSSQQEPSRTQSSSTELSATHTHAHSYLTISASSVPISSSTVAHTHPTATKVTTELTFSYEGTVKFGRPFLSHTAAKSLSFSQSTFNFPRDPGDSATTNAAGIMVTVATGAAAIVSAAASTGASIALLSSLGSCDDDRPKDTVMVYVLSPFYSLGAVAIALGNVGLAMALTALHALLVVLHHRCTSHSQDVGATEYSSLWVGLYHRSMQALRFPTLSLRVWQLMLPGAVFGAVVSVLGDEVHADGIRNLGQSPTIAAGVAVLLIAALYHAAEGYLLWWKVLPRLTFAAWPLDIAAVLFRSRVDRILLYPSGRWVPSSMSELVAAPLLPMRSTQLEPLRFVEVSIAYFLAICNALNRSSVFSSTCSTLPIFLVLLYSMHAILLGVVRPHRNPADSLFATFSSVVYAAISLIKCLRTTTSGQDAVTGLQWCISAMMLVSCMYTLRVRHVIARTLLVTNANDDVTTDNVKANLVSTVPVRQQLENVSLTDIMDVYATGEGDGKVDHHDDLEINIIVNSSEGLYTNSNNNHYATALEDSKDLDVGDQQQQQYLPTHNRTLLESMMGEQYPAP